MRRGTSLQSIPLDKIPHQPEQRLVRVEHRVLPVVVDGVVVLERIATLVLEENARHVAQGERVVVAVAFQLGTVQPLEMVLAVVDLLH